LEQVVKKTNWFGVETTGLPFVKMHGLRNHFIIIDGRKKLYQPSINEIVRICDQQVGVGGDQLLIIDPPSEEGMEKGAHAFMRILHIDGREAEACGNATRCVAWLLLEETDSDKLLLETIAGVLECRRVGALLVSVNMGQISMKWQKIPLCKDVDTYNLEIESGPLKNPIALNIGNPHAVFFLDDLNSIDLEAFAPAIQSNALFPEQVNVGAAQMIDDRNMKLEVYERPGILTTACGSGACVAVYAARARGLTKSNKVNVRLPAGAVDIEILPDDTALMTGPVAYSFNGYLPES